MPETPVTRTLPLLLHIATVTTGLIDAISYLALGHVFTANMTGNVVFLAFAAPEEIVQARSDWESHQRFGEVKYLGPRLDAPPLERFAPRNSAS